MDDLFYSGLLDTGDDLRFLSKFKCYERGNDCVHFFQEQRNSAAYKRIRDHFQLENIAGDKSEISMICNLRQWVYKTFRGQGEFRDRIDDFWEHPWNILAVEGEMAKKPFKAECGTMAMIMTEVLLSMGFISRWVQCLPLDLRPYDTHCVSHVWSNEYKKWIIVDADQDVLYFNDDGIPLGLADYRQAIINKERIWIWSTTERRKGREWLKSYWHKNIFRFHCLQYSGISMFSVYDIVHYYLDPVEYEISDKEYMIGGHKVKHIHTHDDSAFWSSEFLEV